MADGSKSKSRFGSIKARRQAICWLCLLLLLLIIIALAVVYLTLYRPKDPHIAVQSLQLSSFYLAGYPSAITSLNLTLNLLVTVHNTNRATFHVSYGSAYLYFYGAQTGLSLIPSGDIDSRSRVGISVQLSVQTMYYLQGPFLTAGINAGFLPFETSVVLRGRVKTLNLFTHHSTIQTKCELQISLSSRSLETYYCKNDISL